MARVQLPESKLRARRRRRRFAATAAWSVLALFVVGGLAAATHLPHFRLAEVAVVGVEGTEAAQVVVAVKDELEGNYFFLFPRSNVFIYPRYTIKHKLLKENPMYSSVELDAQGLRTLEVSLVKRTPKAMWCGQARIAPEPCLLLDESGVAYEAAPASRDIVYTAYYGELKPGALPRQYTSEEDYRAVVALVAAIEADPESRIASVEIDKAGDVRMRFAHGFELIFAIKDGGGDVYERFTLAQSADPFANRKLSDFEYLDLRFGDRLYYKLKAE